MRFSQWQARLVPHAGLGVIIDGLVDDAGAVGPADYVEEVLLQPPAREPFFALVDQVGLVVCLGVGGDDHTHRDVRGRSSKGRLSQGEYYHHDGCSGPTKPRVVEIRCPVQQVPRHVATAIAPYPEVLYALLRVVPAALGGEADLTRWAEVLRADGQLPAEVWDQAQGAVNRAVRRGLAAEEARAYFRAVDDAAGAYRAPWAMGESRFIANNNPTRTMQHRRAYLTPHVGGQANGQLVKRWPANPELEVHG